jgi:hypothetical protein
MNRIHVIGERAIYWFKDKDGNMVHEFDTAKDYNDRFIDRVKSSPKKSGYTYVRGKRATLFDTPDGFIHDDEFAITEEGGVDKVLVMLPGGKFLNLPKEEVSRISKINGKAETYKGNIGKSDVQKIKEIKNQLLWQ